MGQRSDEVREEAARSRTNVRGRGSEEIVGRPRENADRETTEDTERIRSEIARTREDMSETIDEIQDRLSPRNLMSQARETVKEKTVGRVKQAARTVGQSASEMAEQTREVAADAAANVRQNPWPAIMIGAGTAWMLIEGARRQRTQNVQRTYVDYDAGGTTEYYDATEPRAAYSQPGSVYGSERSYGADTLRKAGNGARRVSSQFQQLLQRNPLAVGAAAAAVGVVLGLALPETERENRLMGDARDNLVERAQDAAQGAVKKAKQVAGEAAKEVADEAAKQVTEPRRR